jgi:flagellar hook-length control protein FliK
MIDGNLALAGSMQGSLGSMSTAGSSKSQGLDFGSIMSQSLSTKANAKDGALYTDVSSLQKNSSGTNSGTGSGNAQSSAVTAGNGNATGTASTKTVDVAGGNAGNSTAVAQTPSKDDAQAEAVMGAVNEALQGLKEEIKKTLGVTDDEIEAAMEVLGLSMTDLLNPNSLTELVASLTNQDGVMSLITDSDLADQLKSLLDFAGDTVDGLAKQLQVTPDELKELVNTADAKSFDKELETAVDSLPEDVQKPQDAVVADRVQADGSQSQADAGRNNDAQADSFTSRDEDGKDAGHNLGELSKHGGDGLANIATNIMESVEQVITENATDGLNQLNAVDIVQQIMDNVKVMANESLQSIEMQLNPENLGKLHLTITAKDGVMTAQITAQDEAVKRAIESQLAVLKENFDNQGLKVEAVEVMVESHRFDNSQDMAGQDRNQNPQGRGSRRLSAADLAELGISVDEPTAEPEEIINDGSSVSYRA